MEKYFTCVECENIQITSKNPTKCQVCGSKNLKQGIEIITTDKLLAPKLSRDKKGHKK
jgi:Zn finger protein HypA/HybF involved in hydrogenase expression